MRDQFQPFVAPRSDDTESLPCVRLTLQFFVLGIEIVTIRQDPNMALPFSPSPIPPPSLRLAPRPDRYDRPMIIFQAPLYLQCTVLSPPGPFRASRRSFAHPGLPKKPSAKWALAMGCG